jgi:hypothetical protein
MRQLAAHTEDYSNRCTAYFDGDMNRLYETLTLTRITARAPPIGIGRNMSPEIPALKPWPWVKTIGYAVKRI